MNEIKILISFDLPGIYVKRIEDVSARVRVQKSERYEELLELVEDADVLFPGIFSYEMFLVAKKLKWIQSRGAGVDRFLFPEVVKSQVLITTASGVHPTPISEHVIGMMLCFSRRLHYFIRNPNFNN